MSDATKNLIIRVLIHGAVLYVLYVLQGMVFSRLPLFGVLPLILPLSVVGVGLFEGPSWGAGVGLAAGVLCDIALGSTVLFTIALTGLGMGVGLLSSYLISRGFPSYVICCAAALLVLAFMQMFTLLVFLRQPPLALFRVGALQTAYSMLFALPMYVLTRSLARRAKA
ncbi:MAG: hypothetical protein FWE08_07400 [Oscillospiraceae bacterium]|nr:hypothetical protein [Oscillospiraceae bacterium]